MEDEKLVELLNWINSELANGKTRNEIVKQLSNNELNPNDIEKLIDTAIEFQKIQMKNNKKNGAIPPFIMYILSLIIMFTVLNGIIYGAQEIYYWNDVKKCESMKVKLKNLKKEINKIEDFINFRKTKLDRINQLTKEIKQGLSKDYTKYKKMVNEYNSKIPKYKKSMNEYDSLIVEYNKVTREYNELAKDAYSRWLLLPIPLPSKHIHF